MGNAPHGTGSPRTEQERSRQQEPFATELMRLKHRGCCVLVTGQVSEEVRAAQSRQLFGDIDVPHRRILALTDATPADTNRYLPDSCLLSRSTVTVLDYTTETRESVEAEPESSASVYSPPISSAHVRADTEAATATDTDSRTGVWTDDYGWTLGSQLSDAIGAAIRAECVTPGELRLGVATLGTLIATDGLSETRTFVRTVRTNVMAVNGMSHFHLPGVPDTDIMDALLPIIDIHLELREFYPRIPEHRWHLLETDHSTDWLPL